MSTPTRVWISASAHRRLHAELNELNEMVARDAVGEDGIDDNLLAIQRARQSRIQQIHDLLVYAVVGDDPPDDGVAEPGMVLTVRYDDDDDDTETFLLGVRGTEHDGMEVYSLQSPLGRAILGAQPGEQRSYLTPAGTPIAVTLLTAVPYGLHRLSGGDGRCGARRGALGSRHAGDGVR